MFAFDEVVYQMLSKIEPGENSYCSNINKVCYKLKIKNGLNNMQNLLKTV